MNLQPYTPPDFDQNHQIPRPAVMISLGLMSGIVYAHFFPANLSLLLIISLILISAWFAYKKRSSHEEGNQLNWSMVLIISFLLGASRTEIQLRSYQQMVDEVMRLSRNGIYTITGRIDEINIRNVNVAAATLSDVSFEKAKRIQEFPGKLQLRSGQQVIQSLSPGQFIKLKGELNSIQGPKVPTGWNYQEYLFSKKIFATVYVESENIIEIFPNSNVFMFNRIRGLSLQALERMQQFLPEVHFLGSPNSEKDMRGLISAICFGLRTSVSDDLGHALTVSGLAHITSISGLHVTLVLLGTAFLLKKVGFRRKQAALITLVFALFYVMLVGARIPTIRASMMAFVFLGQYFTERRVDSLNSLGVAALILLIIDPMELFLPSFQLSFTAVLVLLLFRPLFDHIMQSAQLGVFGILLSGAAASLLVIIGLSPFILYYFHMISWGAVIGNLAAIPLVYILLPTTYIWLLLSFILPPALTEILGYIPATTASLLIDVIHFFSHELFWAIIPFPGVTFCILFFLSFLLLSRPGLTFFEFNTFAIRAYHISLFLIALAIWIAPILQPFQPLRVDFLGLGQGDCIVIRMPDNKVIIVDGGPPIRTSHEKDIPVLVDYLLAQGISRIDMMILSHPQADHIGAFKFVVEHFPVSMFLEGERHSEIKAYHTLIESLEKHQVPRTTITQGDCIQIGEDTKMWVLHPDEAALRKNQDVNEKSVVLLFQHEGFDLLLTGDIGKSTEKLLCARYGNWDTDILKVPHHGSRYSTTQQFLLETKPEIAVIQAGKNTYGHPHQDTLERLRTANAFTFRTDHDGTVRMRTFGEGVRVYGTMSNRLVVVRE